MANIGSKIKGGAYPVPEGWRDPLWRLFKPFSGPKGKRALILDPFANTGEMLLRGAEMLNMEPFAIELQDEFIEKGRQNMADFYNKIGMPDYSLTRFAHDDSFNTQMSNGGFSIVYINSPFDDMIVTSEHVVQQSESYDARYRPMKQRFELMSLKHNIKYVAPGGYVVWIAYAQHMTRAVFRIFRNNFDQLRVFRFPEPHLDHYTLIAVVAQYVKGHEKFLDGDPRIAEVEDAFVQMGKHPETIMDITDVAAKLTAVNGYLYKSIPSLNIWKGQVVFEPSENDPKAALKLNEKYGAHLTKQFARMVMPTKERPLEKPLHRPNKRQIVVYIAAGMLDNIYVDYEGMRALLRGSVQEFHQKIAEDKETISGADGAFTRIKTTTLIRPDHHIILLFNDGESKDLSGADALKSLIQDNADMLVDAFNERFQPRYDMFVHPVWDKMIRALHPGGIEEQTLTPAQRRVIVCTIENLATSKRQITNAQQGSGKTPMSGVTMIGLRLLHMAMNYNGMSDELPALAKRFDIKGEELIDLVSSVSQRWHVDVKDMIGIPVDKSCMVSVPAIAPSVWMKQELPPLYTGFRMVQIFNPTEADEFFELAAANKQDEIIYVGVMTYESAKSNEGREPMAMPRRRYGRVNEMINGQATSVIKVTKKPAEPVTGVIITDHKGNEVPWARFTPEKRAKEGLQMFSGDVFWGYKSDFVMKDGKKVMVAEKGKDAKRLYTKIVPRPLSREEEAINLAEGYPKIATAYLPMWSEERMFGAPKIGNGWAITPMIEKIVPARTFPQTKFHRHGFKCAPYIDMVTVKEHTILVPDFKNQKNLLPDQPITDPWLAWKGIRYTESSGKRDSLDKAMRLAKKTYYRVGGGVPDLDMMLKKYGLNHYTIGVGKVVYRNPRYPVANYIRRFHRREIALFIADELHMAKSNVTEVSASFRDFAQSSEMVLGLTGTFYGGKASSVYSLSYAFDELVREMYPWTRGAPMKWIEDMGVLKVIETRDVGNTAAIRSGKKQAPRVSEAPGASPMLMRILSEYTLWFSLYDMGDRMPDKEELSYEVLFDVDQRELNDMIYQVTRDYNADLIVTGDRSFLAPMYQNNLSAADAMHRPWTVKHNIRGDKGAARAKYAEIVPFVVLEIPSLGPALKAKEREALAWLKKDLADGRRVVITMIQTESRDIRDRWLQIIQENVPEAKAFILNQSTKSSKRGEHIKKMANEGYNVMITNGGLIAVAISINNFSAMYAVEFSPSLYNFSQYQARINRPNQERRDIVYRHFYYGENKFQRQAIIDIAAKTKASAVLQGVEGGDLAAMAGEEIVPSYSMILDAIEEGHQKRKTAADIQEAFSAASYSSGSWRESAWYVEGDEKEKSGRTYEEEAIVIEPTEREEVEPLEYESVSEIDMLEQFLSF